MSSEPLLLLSGLGSDADAWRDQAAALGGLAVVPQGESIAAMAAGVLAAAPPRFAIAGHSMGGYVALAMALAAPERISRIALLNTSAAADTPAQRETRLRTIAIVKARGIEPLLASLPRLLSADPEIQQRAAAMFRRAGAERVLREHGASLDRPDRRAELPEIALPTLVVGSTDDPIVPPAGSHELAAGISGARLVMLPQGGHLAPMTCAPRITALLREWAGLT